MKNNFWSVFLVIFYLSFFAGVGFFIYRYMVPDYFIRSSPNDQFITTPNANKLYFYSDNALFQIIPSLDSARLNSGPAQKVRSDIKIGETSFDQKKEILYYENLELNPEIWQLDFSTNLSKKIFSSETPGLENLQSFAKPKASPDEKNILFLAQNNQNSYLFLGMSPDFKTLKNLTLEKKIDQLIDFSWAGNEKILLTLKDGDKFSLESLDLTNDSLGKLWTGIDAISRAVWTDDKVFAIITKTVNNHADSNIYNLDGSEFKKLTFLNFPNRITGFQLFNDAKNFLIESEDSTTKTNKLLTCTASGDKFVVLSGNLDAKNPILSTKEDQLVFRVDNDGIYKTNLATQKTNKIFGSQTKVNNIIIWR